MKRRSFFSALAGMFVSTGLVKADTLEQWIGGSSLDAWLKSSAPPGNVPLQAPPSLPRGTVVPQPLPTPTKRAMTWALTCLRHGAHWTFEGINWMRASIGFMRNHLVSVHGHHRGELEGLSKEQLANLHDAHHEGRSFANYSIPRTPRNGVDHLPMSYESSSCPGGRCPIKKRHRRA